MKKTILNKIAGSVFVFAIVISLICTANLIAQENAGGEPISSLIQLSSVFNSVSLPAVDSKKAMEEDKVTEKLPDMPFRYGLTVNVDYSLSNSGTWETLSDGSRVWRLGIKSTDAKSMNLFFSNFYMPKGAFVFIYNLDKSKIIGAFTEINNSVSGEFATALITGNYTVIEYYEPVYSANKGKINISKVIHAYKSISGNNVLDLPCEININCPVGAPWVEQKRSVARMLFTEGGGGFICTGSLINNTLNNRTPYFLTAQHCTSDNWSSLVADFNYESAECNGTTSTPYQTLSGAVSKAENYGTDFRLLQFNNPIPANVNAYYNGWDASGAQPQSGTGIHHPDGQIKKISFDSDPLNTDNGFGGRLAGGFWSVFWNLGMIEGGSSGSPIFDQNKRCVGQLLGGYTPTCNNIQSLYYTYGKVSSSWSNGGSPSNELKDWLDPNNSGVTTLNGLDDITGIAPITNFTSSIQILPIGGGFVNFYDMTTNGPTSWSWSFPGGTPSTSTDQNPTNILYTATGAYTVSLTTTNAFGSNLKTFVNYIGVSGVTLNPFSLQSPPPATTVLVSAQDPSIFQFKWGTSNPSPTVKYLFKIKRLATTTDLVYQSDNNGLDTVISLRRSFLDSIAVTLGLTGDSVRCTWRAAATNGLDTLTATAILVTLRRVTVGINQISSLVPEKFNLFNNYPNPFNPKTVIKFDVAKSELVKMVVYNMLGEVITTLVNQNLTPGSYSVDFDAGNFSSGMYFYRIETRDYSQTKRMVLVK